MTTQALAAAPDIPPSAREEKWHVIRFLLLTVLLATQARTQTCPAPDVRVVDRLVCERGKAGMVCERRGFVECWRHP